MTLTDQNGNKYELNDICNLDHILGRFRNYYFSASNQKIWKSKVTHFCRHTGIFRERVKGVHSGFTYKVAQILPDGSITTLHIRIDAAESLTIYKELTHQAQPVTALI